MTRSGSKENLIDVNDLEGMCDRLSRAVDTLDVRAARRILDLADEAGTGQVRSFFFDDMFNRLRQAIEACDPEGVRCHLQFMKDIDSLRKAETDIEVVKEKLRELNPYLQETYNVTVLGVFKACPEEGSGEEDDWQLLLDVKEPLSTVGFTGIENYLSDALGIRVILKEGHEKYVGEHIVDHVEFL